jgi:hypothetical protein
VFERGSIGRRVKSKYLCEDVIQECVEEEDEDEICADDASDSDLVCDKDETAPVDFTYEEWVAQGNEVILEDVPLDVESAAEDFEEPNVRDVDLDVKVSAERIDVFSEGKTVKPLDDETKGVLKRLKEVFSSKAKESVPSLKCRNQLEVKKQLRLVNGVAGNLAVFCQSISFVNHLLYACSFVVAERLGLKKKKAGGRKEKEEPWWKRRIDQKVKKWRKDLSRIEELRRKNWKPSEAERTRMNN